MSSSLPSCPMEQGYIPPRKQPQGATLGWTQLSVLPLDAIEAPSQSASSAVISPASHNTNDAASECSGQSTSSLKERDYIGLAEVSSAPSSSSEPEVGAELNLSETDLRLGLGPASDAVDNAPESLKCEAFDAIPSSTSHNVEATDVAARIRDDMNSSRSISSTWQSAVTESFVGAMQFPHMSGFQGSAATAALKNGGKRMYAEAMVHVSREGRPIMNVSSSSGTANVCGPRLGANQIVPSKQFQDPDLMSHPLRPQGVYWAPPHVPSWQPQCNHHSVATQKGMAYAGERDGEVPQNAKLDLMYRSDNTRVQSVANEESAPDEAPPAKGQVVGWPPVRSYRRSTLATRTKPPGDEGDGQSVVYVKVNMEGIPIGRKVDLNAYKSYESLLSALEDMFHNPNSGLGARFLKGSEFVLTYEDKEGDWMLVGDVPWGMFVNTVRRLRIARGSDMTGLGSRASCHA